MPICRARYVCSKYALLYEPGVSSTTFGSLTPSQRRYLLGWRDAAKAETAAEAMKITASDLKELGIIDQIVKEPEGGAHTDLEAAARLLEEVLDRQLAELTSQSTKALVEARYKKFRRMGQYFDLQE